MPSPTSWRTINPCRRDGLPPRLSKVHATMAELPYTWNAVLNALLDGPVGWKSPAQVAEAVGGDVSATTDVLCDLDLGGWLSVQETESGVHVALSALGAERLGVRLGEFGPRRSLAGCAWTNPSLPRRSPLTSAVAHAPRRSTSSSIPRRRWKNSRIVPSAPQPSPAHPSSPRPRNRASRTSPSPHASSDQA